MASLFKNPLQALRGQDDAAALGPLATAQQAKQNPDKITYENVNGIDPRWVHVGDEIDGTRWNKNFPYQLMLLERQGGGYVQTEYVFTLPINPQDMTISTPSAIALTVTLGGVVEEHNGAPLRQITLNCTTGVTPLRGSAAGASQRNVLQGILAGTVTAAQNLATNAKSLAGFLPTKHNIMEEGDADAEKATGYYQFRLLQKFIEAYLTLKKQGKTNLRLGLAVWKDQAIYLVKPDTLVAHRSAQSPWEYPFTLTLTAWGRITLGIPGPDANDTFRPVARDANAFAQLLNKVQQARRVLQGARDVLQAVSADVDRVLFEPLREVTLFCKDSLGVVITAADLPSSISSSFKASVLEATNGYEDLKATAAAAGQAIENLGVKSGKAESKGGSTSAAGALTGADEANRIFDNPQDYFELMEGIRPSDLNLPPATQRKINDEKERIRRLTRLDFEKARDRIKEFQAQVADAVGAGSETYNATYGRRTVAANKIPTQDDFDALFALNQTILELNRLAASGTIGQTKLTTVDAVAGMATAAGIAFTTPTSKFAVPFPYGSTLEQLSAQYLGTPDRWHEIAALNGLRQPYVDEEGFDLILQVNGVGNIIQVGAALNLYVGQLVTLSSTSTSRTQRRITKIDRINPTTTILTLDGDPDLDRFTVLAQAQLHAYLPDTVNSQQLIYIPSDIEADTEDFFTKSIPGVDEFDQLIRVGGTDLLLTSSGDLAVTPDGDCRLATGLTNIVQRIKIALGTPKGSLLHHPDFGLGLIVGINTGDIDVKQALATLQDMFRSDPAFAGVSGVSILKSGPSIRVAMSVAITGTNQTIPLTVDIRR